MNERIDRIMTITVYVLWTVLFLSLGALIYQQIMAATYMHMPPGAVRGSMAGPGR